MYVGFREELGSYVNVASDVASLRENISVDTLGGLGEGRNYLRDHVGRGKLLKCRRFGLERTQDRSSSGRIHQRVRNWVCHLGRGHVRGW